MEHMESSHNNPPSSGRTIPAPKQLTWVNYVDPTKERKEKENKATVRKAAKLSTTRPRTKPGISRSRARIVPLTVTPSKSFEGEKIQNVVFQDSCLNYHELHNAAPRIWLGNSDPFDSLPASTNYHSFSLLNRYCESLHIQPDCPTSCYKTQELRRRYLLPTLVQSKGTLHVACKCYPSGQCYQSAVSLVSQKLSTTLIVLHLGRKWKLQNDFVHSKFQAHYQRETILEVQKALQNPTSLVPIEMFLMIGKLATAASHQGDHFAVEAHYNGMAQLFMHHWYDLARHPLFVLGIFAFWSAVTIPNTCCQEQAENSAHKTSPRPASADEISISEQLTNDAFLRLHLAGMISQETLDVIPDMIRLSQLITYAKTGTLTTITAKQLLRLKWRCSAHLQKLGGSVTSLSTTRFERTLWLVLELILTLCVNHSMPIVAEYYCPAVKEHLSNLDLSLVLESCPEALVWMLLVVGSCCPTDDSSTPFCLMTLRFVASHLNITRYDNALLYARQFIWTSDLDEGVGRFWFEAMALSRPSNISAIQ